MVDRARFEKLAAFVEWGIDMQLADVRDLLRLPMADCGLGSGQNFASAAALVNVIAGASVWFYNASPTSVGERGTSAKRFRGILRDYWPWDGEVLDRDAGIDVLYTALRNPLAHAFGMPDPQGEGGVLISIGKSELTLEQITELEVCEESPGWVGSTITPGRHRKAGRSHVINVPALYWGVQRLLRRILADEDQAPAADELAGTLLRFLTHPDNFAPEAK